MRIRVTGGWQYHSERKNEARQHIHELYGQGSNRVVVETDFMTVEILPFEFEMAGEGKYTGEALQVTLKSGMIGDAEVLNVLSTRYLRLVTEAPTIVFSLAKPKGDQK